MTGPDEFLERLDDPDGSPAPPQLDGVVARGRRLRNQRYTRVAVAVVAVGCLAGVVGAGAVPALRTDGDKTSINPARGSTNAPSASASPTPQAHVGGGVVAARHPGGPAASAQHGGSPSPTTTPSPAATDACGTSPAVTDPSTSPSSVASQESAPPGDATPSPCPTASPSPASPTPSQQVDAGAIDPTTTPTAEPPA